MSQPSSSDITAWWNAITIHTPILQHNHTLRIDHHHLYDPSNQLDRLIDFASSILEKRDYLLREKTNIVSYLNSTKLILGDTPAMLVCLLSHPEKKNSDMQIKMLIQMATKESHHRHQLNAACHRMNLRATQVNAFYAQSVL